MSPLSSLGLTLVLYALAVAVVCAVAAVTGGRRPPLVTPALVVLQLGLVLQALLDAAELLRGRGDERMVNLAYVLTSLAVLPVTAGVMRDPGRWSTAGFAVGCLLVVVIVVRLHQTLGSAHG